MLSHLLNLKWENIFLILIFILFITLHFSNLSIQEFVGDEASPMLLIDRMWDGIASKDIRFLAYPFLFYMDPFRSIFSGTILHFFGPDKIMVRLPSIIFGLLTFCLLTWIFKKEKIIPWLMILSISSYSLSALVINDRSGGGDAQTRFLFLLTGYLLWKGIKKNKIQKLQLSLVTWTIGILTMLDTLVLFPGVIVSFWKKRFLIDEKTRFLMIGVTLLFFLYFLAWLILPYLAYKSGFQEHFVNRGLFYYFSRVNEGILTAPLNSIYGLASYTSILFTLWLMAILLLTFKIKKFLFLQLLTTPAWISVIILSHSSFHIIMYVAFFFYQAVIVTNYLVKQYPLTRIPVAIFLSLIIFMNASNLFTNFFIFSSDRKTFKLSLMKPRCLDNAVIKIYKNHHRIPKEKPCITYVEK